MIPAMNIAEKSLDGNFLFQQNQQEKDDKDDTEHATKRRSFFIGRDAYFSIPLLSIEIHWHRVCKKYRNRLVRAGDDTRTTFQA